MSAFDPKRTSSDENSIKLSNWVGTVAQVLEALQNGGVPSRLVALGDPGCEHVFKVIYDLPVPSRAALINAAVKCRFVNAIQFSAGAHLARRNISSNADSGTDNGSIASGHPSS